MDPQTPAPTSPDPSVGGGAGTQPSVPAEPTGLPPQQPSGLPPSEPVTPAPSDNPAPADDGTAGGDAVPPAPAV